MNIYIHTHIYIESSKMGEIILKKVWQSATFKPSFRYFVQCFFMWCLSVLFYVLLCSAFLCSTACNMIRRWWRLKGVFKHLCLCLLEIWLNIPGAALSLKSFWQSALILSLICFTSLSLTFQFMLSKNFRNEFQWEKSGRAPTPSPWLHLPCRFQRYYHYSAKDITGLLAAHCRIVQTCSHWRRGSQIWSGK